MWITSLMILIGTGHYAAMLSEKQSSERVFESGAKDSSVFIEMSNKCSTSDFLENLSTIVSDGNSHSICMSGRTLKASPPPGSIHEVEKPEDFSVEIEPLEIHSQTKPKSSELEVPTREDEISKQASKGGDLTQNKQKVSNTEDSCLEENKKQKFACPKKIWNYFQKSGLIIFLILIYLSPVTLLLTEWDITKNYAYFGGALGYLSFTFILIVAIYYKFRSLFESF